MKKLLKIGVFAESFGVGLFEGIKRAAQVGAQAVQISTVTNEISPDSPKSRRAEIRDFAHGHGLKIASVCGDMGGHGLAIQKDNETKLPVYIKQIELAADLGCDVITSHIGVIPADENDGRYGVLLDAMAVLGERAKGAGVRWAIETGPETPEVLRRFIDRLPDTVGVNLDPANLVMVTGSDPIAATKLLADRIYHCHVKDGTMIKYIGPEAIYGFFAEGGIGDLRMWEYFFETPLGQGSVNIPKWIAAMRETGYDGYYTIERETGDDPQADILAAVACLRAFDA